MPMIQQAQAKKNKQPPPKQQSPEAMGEEPATPEEQESYEEAMEMLYKMMYVDDKTSATILDMIQPNAKVDSIVKTSVLVIQQLDEKLDLDAAVIPEMVITVPDMLIELAERGKQIQFSEGELKAILGSTQEMVMQVVDVDAGEARRLMEQITPEQRAQAERDYKQFLAEAEGENAAAAQPVRPDGAEQGAAVPSEEGTGAVGQTAAPGAADVASGTGEAEVMA